MSIRKKLFLIFIIFMITFVLSLSLANLLFLEKYYIFKNEDVFLSKYETIMETYNTNTEEVNGVLNRIERLDGIRTIIADNNFTARYHSFPQQISVANYKVPVEIRKLIQENKKAAARGHVYKIVDSQEYEGKELVFISKIDDKNTIILIKSMKSINESANIANEFFAIIGASLTFIGGVFLFFFSKKITEPIVNISQIADEISNLNFEKKFRVTSNDEIGLMGESINRISEKLSITIEKLNTSNGMLKNDVQKGKQIDEMRKSFIRNVSHELKTPIGVIKGYIEGLKYRKNMNADSINKYYEIIVDECDRMDNLVKGLLELSRLEDGIEKLNNTTFDVGQLTRNVLAKFKPILDKENIKYHIETDKEYYVNADYEKIEQVVQNYLVNAIEHVNEKRIIKTSVSKSNGRIRVGLFNSGGNIPESEADSIWKVFYKVDMSRTRTYGGSGIGLSIVKSILKLHNATGGFVNLDGGVEFYFELNEATFLE